MPQRSASHWTRYSSTSGLSSTILVASLKWPANEELKLWIKINTSVLHFESQMKVLVCGGAGYIGSHLVHQLSKVAGYEITVMDNLSTGHRQAVPDSVKFELGDIRKTEDLERIFASLQPEAVFVTRANSAF